MLEGSISRSFKGVLTQKLKNYSDSSTPSLSASLAAQSARSGGGDDPKLAKMKAVQASLNDLASSAKQNLDKVISRGEAIESLRDRSGALHTSSDVFRKHSKKLNQRLCMENLKLKLLIAIIILVRPQSRHARSGRRRGPFTYSPAFLPSVLYFSLLQCGVYFILAVYCGIDLHKCW